MPTIDYQNVGVVIKHEFVTGVITAFDYESQTATVRTISAATPDNPATPKFEGQYVPVKKKEYSDVTFFYHCSGSSVLRAEGSIEGGIAGFMIGDEVVMDCTLSESSPLSTDYSELRIIGHTDEPRHCRSVRIYQTYVDTGVWRIGVYDVVGDSIVKTNVLTPAEDFTGRYDIQADKPIYVVEAHCDTNKLFVVCHYKTMIDEEEYIWPLLIYYRIRYIFAFDQNYYCAQHSWSEYTDQPFAFNCGEPWNNGMMAGGYRVQTSLDTSFNFYFSPDLIETMWDKNYAMLPDSDYTGLVGTKCLPWLVGLDNVGVTNAFGDFGWPCCQVQNKAWIDDNNNNQFNEHAQDSSHSFSTEIDPPDYHQRYVQIRGIGFVDNRIILGVLICYDDEHTPENGVYPYWYPSLCDPCQNKYFVESYIAIFEGPPYNYAMPYLYEMSEPIYWETPAFLDFERTRLLNISSIAEFERINQILGYDERIFISWRLPAVINLYDAEGNQLASVSPGGDNLCSMAVVENVATGKPCLSCQAFGGPIVFYDIDTLEVVESFDIPDAFTPPTLLESRGVFYAERQSSVAVNVPILTKAVYQVEKYKYLSNIEDMRIISYSPVAQKLAQSHANWCVEHGRCSHDEGGVMLEDVTNRAHAVGLNDLGENLVLQYPHGDYLEKAIEGWAASPGHKAILQYKTDEGMGMGIATYPESCDKITMGEGAYNADTGEYSTSDTVINIPKEYRGRMKIIVYNGYGY